MLIYSNIKFFCLLLISNLTVIASTKHLPSDIEVCHKSDPQLNDCFTRSILDAVPKFQQGYPELGISRLEPFFVEALDLDDDNSDTVALKQHYENMNIYGMTKTTIKNMNASIEDGNCFWQFDAQTPEVRIESDYRITGKILLFTINGHGKCQNIFYNLAVKHSVKCEFYKKSKNQKTHLRIIDYQMKMQPEKIHFHFENVVESNKQLSEEISKTINENAQNVFDDVKNGFEKSFAQIYQQVTNNIFERVPADELFPQ